VVVALAGLARICAHDDPGTARALAAEAVERATSLERAPALCAFAWVELSGGECAAAVRLAEQAETEARSTDDRPSLARALELQGAAAEPPALDRLEAAAGLWRELGDPIAARRAQLMAAACRGDDRTVEQLRGELARFGVRPEAGPAGLLLSGRRTAADIDVRTLGRFTVLRRGEPIPLTAWQSRKARDLLKLLASRRGRPVTRDAAAEALWPNEDPGPLANRLSVALSTLRKVLDPNRAHAPDHFIAADQQSLALCVDHVSLDVAGFLAAAAEGVALAAREEWKGAEGRLREAEALYTGDFLEEDLYEDWPVDCREEARTAAQEVSRVLARLAMRRGNDEEATRHLRRLLERDPYDADAWTAMMAAQLRLRRYGEARRQHAVYARRMAELAIAPVPLAETVDARP
jgi:DNA-binding SARP family transcriptional activator